MYHKYPIFVFLAIESSNSQVVYSIFLMKQYADITILPILNKTLFRRLTWQPYIGIDWRWLTETCQSLHWSWCTLSGAGRFAALETSQSVTFSLQNVTEVWSASQTLSLAQQVQVLHSLLLKHSPHHPETYTVRIKIIINKQTMPPNIHTMQWGWPGAWVSSLTDTATSDTHFSNFKQFKRFSCA